MQKTDKKQPAKPFFARFLEKQELDTVTGGDDLPLPKPPKPPLDRTQKFPSDDDDEE